MLELTETILPLKYRSQFFLLVRDSARLETRRQTVGRDGVSFEFVETQGVEKFLQAIQNQLLAAPIDLARTDAWRFPKGMRFSD
jgi:hypothetical protein